MALKSSSGVGHRLYPYPYGYVQFFVPIVFAFSDVSDIEPKTRGENGRRHGRRRHARASARLFFCFVWFRFSVAWRDEDVPGLTYTATRAQPRRNLLETSSRLLPPFASTRAPQLRRLANPSKGAPSGRKKGKQFRGLFRRRSFPIFNFSVTELALVDVFSTTPGIRDSEDTTRALRPWRPCSTTSRRLLTYVKDEAPPSPLLSVLHVIPLSVHAPQRQKGKSRKKKRKSERQRNGEREVTNPHTTGLFSRKRETRHTRHRKCTSPLVCHSLLTFHPRPLSSLLSACSSTRTHSPVSLSLFLSSSLFRPVTASAAAPPSSSSSSIFFSPLFPFSRPFSLLLNDLHDRLS